MKVTLCSKNQTTACKPSIKEQYCESSYLYRRERNKTEGATVNDTHNCVQTQTKKEFSDAERQKPPWIRSPVATGNRVQFSFVGLI